jgi:phosphoribosylaminoimidazolecarboxamide formyltransferase/IMP cyclohydrolase
MKKITRALISVSDKTNLAELVKLLREYNIDIVSTGGTYKAISDLGIKATEISDYTGFPEIMSGRVKTLNPLIYGGILADRDKQDHMQAMQDNEIKQIDLVIVNLYPFEATVAGGADFATAIENIDIGGPSMIRATAKNHAHTTILTDPADYTQFFEQMRANDGQVSAEFRKEMAVKAFGRTAKYDIAIYNWFNKEEEFAPELKVNAQLKQVLRYGENPHQKAALYQNSDRGIVASEQIQGKELSYNNIADSDSAFALIKEFSEPAAAIIKHANPCGVAIGDNITEAYQRALECDKVSAFGGIIALNRPLNKELALLIKEMFFEVIITPAIEPAAQEILAAKKNMRILIANIESPADKVMVKSVSGGFLVQDNDNYTVTSKDLKIVTKKQPDEVEIQNLLFAFKVCKHVKSNAIVIAKNFAAIGVGAGQMSRVDSVRLAVERAGSDAKGAVLASDAFFPFADGLLEATKAGVAAFIQPGGSMRDDEVIKAADDSDVAMVTTGIRHFKH